MRISLFETTLNSFGVYHCDESKKGCESLRSSRNVKQTTGGVYGNAWPLDKISKHTYKKKYSQQADQTQIHTQYSQSFLNNTASVKPSHHHDNTQTIPHKQYYSNKVNRNHQEQNKGMSYSKIIEKLEAKEKIIKELKKLSETNVSNKLKQSYRIEKCSLVDCSNQLNTDRIMTPKVNKGNLNESLVFNSPKYQENFNYEGLKNSYYKNKYSKNKNPEELSLSMAYESHTPKIKHKNTIDNSRDLLNLSYNNDYSYVPVVTPPRNEVKPKHMEQSQPTKTKFTIHDFMIGKALGEGKFGTVYQAVHKKSRFLVVLKKISKKSIKSSLMIDQFLLEVKLQSFCDHENIVKLYGFFEDRESVYLILEYMEEGTLFKMLKKNKTVSEQYASKRLKEVGQAIKYLHEKGIVHRDIKPENIVISHGTGKLCDFGWAAICNERRKTYCGTFDYTAPQILEGVEYDLTVDLWCLGILAYQLLVGRAPFYHHSRKQTMKKILNVESASLDFPNSLSKKAISFMQNLIRKKPEERMIAQDVLRHPFLIDNTQQ